MIPSCSLPGMFAEWAPFARDRIRSGWLLVVSTLFMLGIGALYWPVFGLQLMGDDYQWVQHAHHALHRPALLFTDLDTFYRPAVTWTLVLDRVLWRSNAAGYHLTNLILHVCAASLLVRLAARMGIPSIGCWAIGVIWATSPYAFEPAASVAIRFENLLFLSWLGLALLWPGPGQAWNVGRLLGAGALTLTALFSKETWVVTAGIVWAIEWGFRRSSARRALSVSAPFLALAAAYIIAYFLAFPGAKNYYELSLTPLAKVPHQIAAFFYLEQLRPAGFPVTVKGVIAAGILLAVFVSGIRHRFPGALIGIALFCLPMLPTLFVPYLPPRYATIPYAGFLVVLVATLNGLVNQLQKGMRRLIHLLLVAVVPLVVLAGAMIVRADLADFARMSLAHAQLLREARLIARDLPLGQPIAILRMGDGDPLGDIVESTVGLPKVFFVRGADPYGLIDSAALFEWVSIDGHQCICRNAEIDSLPGRSGDVLIHRRGGFVWLARNTPDLPRLVGDFLRVGRPVRVIYCEGCRTSDTQGGHP